LRKLDLVFGLKNRAEALAKKSLLFAIHAKPLIFLPILAEGPGFPVRCAGHDRVPGFPVRGPKKRPRVRLSLRKAAWSASTPMNFTGNPGCAAFIKESRVNFTNATKLNRKSGGASARDGLLRLM
jgi:hypothetical protein